MVATESPLSHFGEKLHQWDDNDRAKAAEARSRRAKSTEQRRLEQMQDVALDVALNDPSKALRLQAMKAYDVLAERLRIVRGEPLPGSFRPEPAKKARTTAQRATLADLNAQAEQPSAPTQCDSAS